jgi:hypothetical protein
MKKILFFAAIIILTVTACKDDGPSQITFSLENLTKLVEKSASYIKKASPGDIYITQDTYLYFKLKEVIEGFDVAYLYYNIESKKCNYIIVLPNEVDVLSDAETLMNLADTEMGDASYYYLSYYDANSVNQEEYFDSLTELWAFISSESLDTSTIENVTSLYHYNDYYIMSGGYYYTSTSDSYFQPVIEIGLYSDLAGKLDDSGKLSKNAMKQLFNISPVK